VHRGKPCPKRSSFNRGIRRSGKGRNHGFDVYRERWIPAFAGMTTEKWPPLAFLNGVQFHVSYDESLLAFASSKNFSPPLHPSFLRLRICSCADRRRIFLALPSVGGRPLIPCTHLTETHFMKSTLLATALAATLVVGIANAGGMAKNPMVGGAAMLPTKDIVDNAVNSKDHTTLVAAVKAAGLVETLKSPGPFTVFAPTNAAFGALPAGTVDTLLKPENKGKLTAVLTYHVVSGRLDGKALIAKIEAGKGKAQLTTVQGATLTAKRKGDAIMVTDTKGNTANVSIANVYQKNGVIHVIDKVLMP